MQALGERHKSWIALGVALAALTLASLTPLALACVALGCESVAI
jgi:hypothetical protein